jgi:hypothetical protein
MSVIRLNIDEVFTTDSSDYHVLHNACIAAQHIAGAVVEIGSRRGGSAKIMMDAFASVGSSNRPFFCIDPYGNIETQLTNLNVNRFYKNLATTEGDPNSKDLSTGVRLDYTNEMRNRIVPSLYYYAFQLGFNFTFFFLEDSEFFKRYADGVPMYDQEKFLINQYACVFFDGPHTNKIIMEEINFFETRSPIGATWVFDDLWQYDHDEVIEAYLFNTGWELLEKTELKASYRKIK